MTPRALSFLLLAVAAAPATAQRRTDAAAPARLEAAPLPAASGAAPALPVAGARVRRSASRNGSAVAVLGGAVIGAGVGFLASQVAWSDWDKSSDSEFKSRRLSLTLGGSALGALTGLVLGGKMDGGNPAMPTGRVPLASRTSVITEEEVRASTALSVYQLVQELRPLWLRREGASGHTNPVPVTEGPPSDHPSAGTAAPVSSTNDDPGVRVYVERGFVGDIFSLRQLAVADVTSLEFLDVATATYRLGQGNTSGAIVVHTGRQR